MKKLIYFCCFLFIGSLFLSACKDNSSPATPEEDVVTSDQKVVAYFAAWRAPYSIEWKKITHLCLAFGFVNADGSLNTDEVSKTHSMIRQAQQNNVSVLLSIGGGGSKNFTEALLNETSRKDLVDNLLTVVNKMQLDGVDVDYEEWDGGPGGLGPRDAERRTALEDFYKQLRAALPEGKLITAAVNAGWDNGGWGTYNCFTNSMHEYLDFVSLMIYDETGPWSGTRVGPHSGWDFFEKAIDHWLNNRKLPKEKLIAGLPFYGYKFQSANSAEGCVSMSYKDILTAFPNEQAHLKDSIGLLYYDGMPTIQKKSQYVKDNGLGGVMFWEITQDTKDSSKSLLNAIYEVFNSK